MVEPLDPNKYHVLSGPQKRNFILVGILIILLFVPLLGFFYYKAAVNRPSQTDKEIAFNIKKGDDVFTIAENLYEKNAINSKFLFLAYVLANKLDRNIQAGVYTIKAGTSTVEVVDQFLHGTDDISITFLEGWRIEEFARNAYSRLENFDYRKFITLASPYEGQLFPDTYFVKRDISEDDLLTLLRSTYDMKTQDVLTPSMLSKIGLTKEQVLIFASIVEREVRGDEDRRIVAGILVKRWKEGMKIDADATTQYAVAYDKSCISPTVCTTNMEEVSDVNWWPNDLTLDDLNSDSPFNTRKLKALPPTPICSPSLSSINAVINMASSDYYYYLNDLEGNTHFAKTLDEHNSNISKYLK